MAVAGVEDVANIGAFIGETGCSWCEVLVVGTVGKCNKEVSSVISIYAITDPLLFLLVVPNLMS